MMSALPVVSLPACLFVCLLIYLGVGLPLKVELPMGVDQLASLPQGSSCPWLHGAPALLPMLLHLVL